MKLKTVFAALGSSGRSHLANAWMHPEVKVVGAFDPSPDQEKEKTNHEQIEKIKQEILRRRGVPVSDLDMYDDYEEMLDKTNPDLVVIASPDKFHVEQTLAALSRNISVLVEKPMAPSLEDCRKIIEAEKKSKGKVMANHCVRFAEKFQAIKKRIDENALGTIYYAESNYVSARYDQLDRGHYDDFHPLLSVGIHAIDIVRWIVGDDVIKVTAEATNIATRNTPYTWPDFTKVNMVFANSALGLSYTTHAVKRPGYFGLLAYGTEGSVMDDHPYYDRPFHFADLNTDSHCELYRIFHSRDWNDQEEIRLGPSFRGFGHMFAPSLEHIVTSIKNNTEPMINAKEATKSLAVCYAAIESLENDGKPVKPEEF